MSCTLSLLLICTFVISNVNCGWKFDDYNTNDLHKCLNRVIKHVFTEDETLLILSLTSFNYSNGVTNPHILFSTEEFCSFKPFIYFKMGIVLHTNGTENIKENLHYLLKTKLINRNLNANVKWIIVTPRQSIRNYFIEFWNNGINNLVVLQYDLMNGDSSLQLYMSDPQAVPNNCGKDFNLLSKQSCYSKIIIEFPQILRKYTNCTFTYVSVSKFNDNSQVGYVVSDFVMNQITNHLNSNFDNIVKNDETQLMVGAHFLRYMDFKASSTIFYCAKAIWAVPKPKRIPLVFVVKIMFKKSVWVLIALSFFLTAIVWWLFLKYKNVNNECDFTLILLNVWETTLFGSVNRLPVLWILRLLILSYALYCIHTQAIFNSKIVEILTIPQYEHGIQNVDELAESNLKIVISRLTMESVFEIIYEFDTNHRYQKIYQLMHPIKDDHIFKVFFDCISKDQCAAFFIGSESYLNKTIFEISHIIEDNSVIGSMAYSFGTLRHNYLSLTFNKIVYNLVESGIIDHFVMSIKKFEIVSLVEEEPLPLTVDQLYIIFIFWAGLFTTLSYDKPDDLNMFNIIRKATQDLLCLCNQRYNYGKKTKKKINKNTITQTTDFTNEEFSLFPRRKMSMTSYLVQIAPQKPED
ncbi:hypothetical protein FQR65_LT02212 [Abscondita terminalis]|nr:hypothetical protein FQR65_LT02212 [Abscondita terminalis]